MEIPKMLVAAITGVCILFFNIITTILFLFVYYDKFGEDVEIVEMSTPITLAYATMVVKWVVGNGGKINRYPSVYPTYVIMLSMLYVAISATLIVGSAYYLWQPDFTAAQLNTCFLLVESFCGLLLIFLNDLFIKDGN